MTDQTRPDQTRPDQTRPDQTDRLTDRQTDRQRQTDTEDREIQTETDI